MSDKLRLYDAIHWIASMAAADGVVTPTERKVIKKFAKAYGVDPRIIYRIAYAIANKIEVPEVELISHSEMVGRKFEEFVVSLCSDKSRFTLLAWRGDKISGQTYALENLLPDLRIRHKIDDSSVEYLMECKFRSSLKDGILDLSSHLKRYRNLAGLRNRSEIFIILGIGGKPNGPDSLYVIPAKNIADDGIICLDKLSSNLCPKSSDSLHNFICCYYRKLWEETPRM